MIRMTDRSWCWVAGTLVLIVGGFFLAQARGTHERVNMLTQSGSGTLALSPGAALRQEISVNTSSVTGIFIPFKAQTLLPPGSVTLQISDAMGNLLSTHSIVLPHALHARQVTYYGEDTTVDQELKGLFFPLALPRPGLYAFEFSVDGGPLLFGHEGDGKKYPRHTLTLNGKGRAGAIEFILFEQPTLGEYWWQWSMQGYHRAVWVGIGILLVSLVITYIWPWRDPAEDEKLFWQQRWAAVSATEGLIVTGLLCVVVFLVFGWTLKLFFFQDDIPILLRVKELPAATAVFTNRPFLPHGVLSGFPIGFYRPASYSLYPWIMFNLFGLHAGLHHAAQLVMVGLLASLLYLFSRLFGSRLFALLAVAGWLLHSSKVGFVSWISSAQDVIACVLFMVAILAYLRALASGKRMWHIIFLTSAGLAFFSKEFALLLPITLFVLELWYVGFTFSAWREWLPRFFSWQAVIGILMGIYLITRALAMGDPYLPHYNAIDPSYSVSFAPSVLWENLGAYASLVWPGFGLVAVILLLAAAAWGLLKRDWKKLYPALVAAAWFVIMLLPYLYLANEAVPRWLTMALWGASALLAYVLLELFPMKQFVRVGIFIILLGAIIWNARGVMASAAAPRAVSFSELARSAVAQYEKQHTGGVSRVWFVDIPDDTQGTVNKNLLHLFFDDVPAEVKFVHEVPGSSTAKDVNIYREYP
ncbi:MAG: hypothetical protein HYZ63_01730 [Candidatus Andersenbacteria bacterium]|nr:hypothetical protein [Candidatus Andersenbacteria bacterium]